VAAAKRAVPPNVSSKGMPVPPVSGSSKSTILWIRYVCGTKGKLGGIMRTMLGIGVEPMSETTNMGCAVAGIALFTVMRHCPIGIWYPAGGAVSTN